MESEAKKDEKDSLRMAAAKDINGTAKVVLAPRPVVVPARQKDPPKAKQVQKPVVNAAAKKVAKKAAKKTDKKKQVKKPVKGKKKDTKAKSDKEKSKKQGSPKYVYPEKKDH